MIHLMLFIAMDGFALHNVVPVDKSPHEAGAHVPIPGAHVPILDAYSLLPDAHSLIQGATPQLSDASVVFGGLVQDDPLGAGLKECLLKGVERAVEELSRSDGYYARPEIRITLPPEAEAAANKLRSLGQSKRVDELILSLNRAAEGAADEAKSLFVDAVRQMKPADALGIVRGGDDAATRYLRSQTEDALVERFGPAIGVHLQQSGAADKWKGFVGIYNRIPGVRRLEADLTRHVCARAIAGLFVRVAEEEKAIRTQPARRTTEILRNVFGRP
jgi:hypothetical protein